MPCCPFTASSFYLLSGLLDAFDGHAARALNQGDRTLPPVALLGGPTSLVLSLLSQNLVRKQNRAAWDLSLRSRIDRCEGCGRPRPDIAVGMEFRSGVAWWLMPVMPVLMRQIDCSKSRVI